MAVPKTDFVSAALRHVRDAEYLLRTDRPNVSTDQAWHLAGFAHECARKAYLIDGWLPKILGHGFSAASEDIVDVAVALDPRAGRFPVRRWSERYPAVVAWRPEHRYERTGTAVREPDRSVGDLVAEARRAVDACLVALCLEGSITMESVR